MNIIGKVFLINIERIHLGIINLLFYRKKESVEKKVPYRQNDILNKL